MTPHHPGWDLIYRNAEQEGWQSGFLFTLYKRTSLEHNVWISLRFSHQLYALIFVILKIVGTLGRVEFCWPWSRWTLSNVIVGLQLTPDFLSNNITWAQLKSQLNKWIQLAFKSYWRISVGPQSETRCSKVARITQYMCISELIKTRIERARCRSH